MMRVRRRVGYGCAHRELSCDQLRCLLTCLKSRAGIRVDPFAASAASLDLLPAPPAGNKVVLTLVTRTWCNTTAHRPINSFQTKQGSIGESALDTWSWSSRLKVIGKLCFLLIIDDLVIVIVIDFIIVDVRSSLIFLSQNGFCILIFKPSNTCLLFLQIYLSLR